MENGRVNPHRRGMWIDKGCDGEVEIKKHAKDAHGQLVTLFMATFGIRGGGGVHCISLKNIGRHILTTHDTTVPQSNIHY